LFIIFQWRIALVAACRNFDVTKKKAAKKDEKRKRRRDSVDDVDKTTDSENQSQTELCQQTRSKKKRKK